MDAIKEAFNDNIYIHPDILPQFNHRMVKNEILKETDLVGTGTKIQVKEDGKLLRQYSVILYGDKD